MDLKVGWGPVTWTGVITSAVWGLGAVSAFAAALAGALPENLAIWAMAVSGFTGTLALAITAGARHFFAKMKANVLPWEEPEAIDEMPEEPTDTPMEPPVEPEN